MKLNNAAMVNFEKNGSTHVWSAPSNIDTPPLPKISYEDYLQSASWIDIRAKSDAIWGHNCLVCNEQEGIDRHHVFYRENISLNKPQEVIPLCRACHQAAHQDGDNKNSKPANEEGLKSIINHLFLSVVKRRGMSISIHASAVKRFWKIFQPFKKELFVKTEPKIQVVKTVYTKWERERFFGKKKKKKRLIFCGGMNGLNSQKTRKR